MSNFSRYDKNGNEYQPNADGEYEYWRSGSNQVENTPSGYAADGTPLYNQRRDSDGPSSGGGGGGGGGGEGAILFLIVILFIATILFYITIFFVILLPIFYTVKELSETEQGKQDNYLVFLSLSSLISSIAFFGFGIHALNNSNSEGKILLLLSVAISGGAYFFAYQRHLTGAIAPAYQHFWQLYKTKVRQAWIDLKNFKMPDWPTLRSRLFGWFKNFFQTIKDDCKPSE